MNLLSSAVRRVAYLVWHSRLRATLNRADACTLFGLDLVIDPGVLHPRHFASSRRLAQHLMSLDLRGFRVADIGAGSGLLTLLAARAGAEVTAVDINPAAVACTSENARRNGLSGRVSARVGNVFDGLPPDIRFDLVVTNPPFYPRDPESLPDHAFAAGAANDFFTKLATGLPGRLAKNGALLLIHSSDADFGPVSSVLAGNGLTGRTVFEKRGFFETLTIREFRATNERRYRT